MFDKPMFTIPELRESQYPTITIFEGPDCSGKTTIVKQLQKEAELTGKRELIHVRCPDNRKIFDDGGVGAGIRDVIMSKELGQYPMAQMFLFMADFVFAYESIIKPNMHRTEVDFILDRFLPSTACYQSVNILYINRIFEDQFPEFYEAFSHAYYYYLNPVDMDRHLARIASRGDSERNHLDPVGLDKIKENIQKYRSFYEQHREYGLLGSCKAVLVSV